MQSESSFFPSINELFINDPKHRMIRHLEENKQLARPGIIRFIDLVAYMEVGPSYLDIALKFPQRTHFEYNMMLNGNSANFRRNWRKFSGTDRGLFGVTQIFLTEYVPEGDLFNRSNNRELKLEASVVLHVLQRKFGKSELAQIPMMDLMAILNFIGRKIPEIKALRASDLESAFASFSDEFYMIYHSPGKKLNREKQTRLSNYIEEYLLNDEYFLSS